MLGGHRLSCGHRFCTPCIAEHVKVKIQSRDVASALACPDCAQPISIADTHALTWGMGDNAAWQQFSAVADEACIEALVRSGQARRCPSAKCNYVFVRAPGDARHYECPSCAQAFCLACTALGGAVGPAHPGMCCATYTEKLEADREAKRKLELWRMENSRADQKFRELMRSELRSGKSKPCPRCKQAITKDGGCHHHTCTSCKVRFCWNCGGYNEREPSKATCGTTCKKPSVTWWNAAQLLKEDPPSPSSEAGAASAPSTASSDLHPLLRFVRMLGGASKQCHGTAAQAGSSGSRPR